MLQRFGFILAFAILTLLNGAVYADNTDAQRTLFLKAREALAADRVDEFNGLKSRLGNYALYPYLEYWYLRDRLRHAGRKQVTAFLERYAGQPVESLLRKTWLKQLAERGDWPDFLADYQGSQSVELQCYRLQAQIHTGKKHRLVERALDLWLVGHSQDKACDPVFKYLEDHKAITAEHRWQRIRLAMAAGNSTLAGYLAHKLPEADQSWVTLWREAHRLPASTLESGQLRKDSPHAREIVLHAVSRLARGDETAAHERWQKIRQQYRFTPDEIGATARDIALIAAWRHNPQAHDWLAAVPDSAADGEVHEWRVRSAIAAQQWPEVLHDIESMPAEQAGDEEWRYWRAMALQQTGADQQAADQLALLARERDYHGFLAADALRWPYVMDNRPLLIDAAELDVLGRQPGFVRAHELYRAELLTDARREWHASIAGLDADGLRTAARLAQSWGWHDRAILTVARSADYNDLVLRFPIDHADDIERYTKRYQLDPGHVLAVIRTESAFNPEARSGAGAMGLMQLMPRTGRITARKYGIPLPGTQHLYEADRNIQIGAAYLKQVMEQYDDNVVLASAAYNAGPHRVQRWLPEDEKLPAENWLAAVPFDETRRYVQRILAYAAIYDWRMERPARPMSEMMPDVKPRDSYSNRLQ